MSELAREQGLELLDDDLHDDCECYGCDGRGPLREDADMYMCDACYDIHENGPPDCPNCSGTGLGRYDGSSCSTGSAHQRAHRWRSSADGP